MGLYEEGIRAAKEASEIAERLGDVAGQANALIKLSWALHRDNQLNEAEEVVSQVIDLLSGRDERFHLCECHYLLGRIYRPKNDTEKAIRHFETALGLASSFNGLNALFCIHYDLAWLFIDQARFDDANSHAQHAKLYAVNDHDSYALARAMRLQARVWYGQDRFEEARSEALRAADAFEKLGLVEDAERIRRLLQRFDDEIRAGGTSNESDDNGESLATGLLPTCY